MFVERKPFCDLADVILISALCQLLSSCNSGLVGSESTAGGENAVDADTQAVIDAGTEAVVNAGTGGVDDVNADPDAGNDDPGGTEEWRFVVYGDTRCSDSNHRRVLAAIVDNTPDYHLILNVGDVVADGDSGSQWSEWRSAVRDDGGTGQDSNPPKYMACPGNHDDLDDGDARDNWEEYLPGQQRFGNGGAFFTVDYKNARFLVMNSDGNIDGNQRDMLLDAVRDNPKAWLFAIWHHPVFAFGSKSYEDEIHDEWGVPLYEGGADVIFMGHAHHYVRTKKLELNGDEHPPLDPERGTVQVITGNGGCGGSDVDADSNDYMMGESTEESGYTEATVTDEALELRHYATSGEILDRATYSPNPK